jgi:hypothetical protein
MPTRPPLISGISHPREWLHFACARTRLLSLSRPPRASGILCSIVASSYDILWRHQWQNLFASTATGAPSLSRNSSGVDRDPLSGRWAVGSARARRLARPSSTGHRWWCRRRKRSGVLKTGTSSREARRRSVARGRSGARSPSGRSSRPGRGARRVCRRSLLLHPVGQIIFRGRLELLREVVVPFTPIGRRAVGVGFGSALGAQRLAAYIRRPVLVVTVPEKTERRVLDNAALLAVVEEIISTPSAVSIRATKRTPTDAPGRGVYFYRPRGRERRKDARRRSCRCPPSSRIETATGVCFEWCRSRNAGPDRLEHTIAVEPSGILMASHFMTSAFFPAPLSRGCRAPCGTPNRPKVERAQVYGADIFRSVGCRGRCRCCR